MLKYIKGSGFVVPIPARDLTDEEVERFGGEEFLLSTGMYELPDAKEKKPKKQENRESKKEGE